MTLELVEEALKRLETGQKSVEEVAEELKVSMASLYAHIEAAPGGGWRARATVVGRKGVAEGRSGSETHGLVEGSKARPGGAEADWRALAERILARRDPRALAEVREGVAIFDAGGDAALEPWLERPVGAARDLPADLLETQRQALALLVAQGERLPPGSRQASGLFAAIGKLSAEIQDELRRRRPPTPPDEIRKALEAADVEVKGRIEARVQEAEEMAARPRLGAPYGVCVTCGSPTAAPLGAAP